MLARLVNGVGPDIKAGVAAAEGVFTRRRSMLALERSVLIWCRFFGRYGLLAVWSFTSRFRVTSCLAAAPYGNETILIRGGHCRRVGA
jgi:hypothetical protein